MSDSDRPTPVGEHFDTEVDLPDYVPEDQPERLPCILPGDMLADETETI